MRWLAILLGSAVLLGCGSSTRVVETNWRSSVHVDEMLGKVRADGSQVLLVGRDDRQPLFDLSLRGDTITLNTAEPFFVGRRWERRRVDLTGPRSNVAEVRVRENRRDYATGILRGAALGFLGGGLVAGLIVEAKCNGSDVYCGVGESLLGLAAGTLIGGIVGALEAPSWKTLYRFRPDTPQQVSVVIGVGPSMTQ